MKTAAASTLTPSANTAPTSAQLVAWMQAAGGGDHHAFRQLAQALGPRMHALAVRLLSGDHAAAQDVLQETLIKLWQTAPRWQAHYQGQSGSVSGYVSRLVYTTAMDQHRRNKSSNHSSTVPLTSPSSSPEELFEDTDINLSSQVENVTEAIQRRQQRAWLLAVIDTLPQRQQQAVILSYFYDYRQAEVARALGTTEKAVESLLVRARRSLAASLPNQAQLSALSHGGYLQ